LGFGLAYKQWVTFPTTGERASSYGYASDPSGIGVERYHVRIFTSTKLNITVGQAHQDTLPPHKAKNCDSAEDKVSRELFFKVSGWEVHRQHNGIDLGNSGKDFRGTPYNGFATLILYEPRPGHFDPEFEETWIIEEGHYPTAGDQYLDEQMEEMEEEEA
jgi:hypothetical protein